LKGCGSACPWSSLGRPDFGKDRGGLGTLPSRFVVWAAVYEAYRGQVVFLIFTAIAVILGVRKFFPKTGSASSSDRD